MRPGDERGFIHKKLLGLGRRAIGFGTSFVAGAGIPIVSQVVRVGRNIVGARGTARDPRFIQARTAQLTRGAPRFTVGAGVGRGEGAGFIIQSGQAAGRQVTTLTAEGTCPTGRCDRVVSVGQDGTPHTLPGHKNRTGYYIQAQPGNPAAGGEWVSAGSRCVSNRRTNAGNGPAAKRAVRRLKAFRTLSKRVTHDLKQIARGR